MGIQIDMTKCVGCGLCVKACHENAIEIIDGKAKLVRENSCDGLGNCLPSCPVGAISFKELSVKWPIQIKLINVSAKHLQNADLFICADCTAFSAPEFYNELKKDKSLIIGCPKLDNIDYSEKLSEILKNNDIKNMDVMRMEVPCCQGIVRAVENAVEKSGKNVAYKIHIVGIDGKLK